MLRVAFYSAADKAGSRAKDAFSHPANGAASIRSLRESLVELLLRWRDELTASGERAPFESDGLQWRRLRLSDGRQVAVQVLDRDETLTPEDLVLHLRPWR